jgi:hypothetical protein
MLSLFGFGFIVNQISTKRIKNNKANRGVCGRTVFTVLLRRQIFLIGENFADKKLPNYLKMKDLQ